MNIVVRYSGLNRRVPWEDLVEAQIKKLQSLASIATAWVTLEWQRGIKPAFRVLTRLEVPGPDYHAECSDHTLEAALRKAVKNLEKQIRSRQNRRAGRHKTNLQLGWTPSRAPACYGGARA